MCLAVPGKIISMDEKDKMPRMAKVNIGGVLKEICIDFLPELVIGDYVMIHVGFAIDKIKEEEAKKQLDAIFEIGEITTEQEDK